MVVPQFSRDLARMAALRSANNQSLSLFLSSYIGTNLIHGKKMCDFTIEFLKCAKFHGKFTVNSRAPQPLFRGDMLMQTKKSVEQHI